MCCEGAGSGTGGGRDFYRGESVRKYMIFRDIKITTGGGVSELYPGCMEASENFSSCPTTKMGGGGCH